MLDNKPSTRETLILTARGALKKRSGSRSRLLTMPDRTSKGKKAKWLHHLKILSIEKKGPMLSDWDSVLGKLLVDGIALEILHSKSDSPAPSMADQEWSVAKPLLAGLISADDKVVNIQKTLNDAQLMVQEKGVDSLALVLAFINYKGRDSKKQVKCFRAPLIWLKVVKKKAVEAQDAVVRKQETGMESYASLQFAAEDICVNETLAYVLKSAYNEGVVSDLLMNRDQKVYSEEDGAEKRAVGVKSFIEKLVMSIQGLEGWSIEKTFSLTLIDDAFSHMEKDLEKINEVDKSPLLAKLAAENKGGSRDNELSESPYAKLGLSFDRQYVGSKDRGSHDAGQVGGVRKEFVPLMDLDASQYEAVQDVLAGDDCLIIGPPGTGKSQTIAAAICALLQEGKRILFVAEKQAAIDVVANRLATLVPNMPFGVGGNERSFADFCLHIGAEDQVEDIKKKLDPVLSKVLLSSELQKANDDASEAAMVDTLKHMIEQQDWWKERPYNEKGGYDFFLDRQAIMSKKSQLVDLVQDLNLSASFTRSMPAISWNGSFPLANNQLKDFSEKYARWIGMVFKFKTHRDLYRRQYEDAAAFESFAAPDLASDAEKNEWSNNCRDDLSIIKKLLVDLATHMRVEPERQLDSSDKQKLCLALHGLSDQKIATIGDLRSIKDFPSADLDVVKKVLQELSPELKTNLAQLNGYLDDSKLEQCLGIFRGVSGDAVVAGKSCWAMAEKIGEVVIAGNATNIQEFWELAGSVSAVISAGLIKANDLRSDASVDSYRGTLSGSKEQAEASIQGVEAYLNDLDRAVKFYPGDDMGDLIELGDRLINLDAASNKDTSRRLLALGGNLEVTEREFYLDKALFMDWDEVESLDNMLFGQNWIPEPGLSGFFKKNKKEARETQEAAIQKIRLMLARQWTYSDDKQSFDKLRQSFRLLKDWVEVFRYYSLPKSDPFRNLERARCATYLAFLKKAYPAVIHHTKILAGKSVAETLLGAARQVAAMAQSNLDPVEPILMITQEMRQRDGGAGVVNLCLDFAALAKDDRAVVKDIVGILLRKELQIDQTSFRSACNIASQLGAKILKDQLDLLSVKRNLVVKICAKAGPAFLHKTDWAALTQKLHELMRLSEQVRPFSGLLARADLSEESVGLAVYAEHLSHWCKEEERLRFEFCENVKSLGFIKPNVRKTLLEGFEYTEKSEAIEQKIVDFNVLLSVVDHVFSFSQYKAGKDLIQAQAAKMEGWLNSEKHLSSVEDSILDRAEPCPSPEVYVLLFEEGVWRAFAATACFGFVEAQATDPEVLKCDFVNSDIELQSKKRSSAYVDIWNKQRENYPDGLDAAMLLSGKRGKKKSTLRTWLTSQAKLDDILVVKPCIMISPLDIPRLMPYGGEQFDVVIMDEASQVRVEEAISSIARGRQLVVVGDPNQMPPSEMFSRAASEEDEGNTADFTEDGVEEVDTTELLMAKKGGFELWESMIQFAEEKIPSRQLLRHYRSKHDSLIAFSNAYVYQNKLAVMPAPDEGELEERGVQFRDVQQTNPDVLYEKSLNLIEAREVADFVAIHLASSDDRSIGIVTLNMKQAEEVERLIGERVEWLDDHPEAKLNFRRKEEAWKKKKEHLFIKSVEHVQGDERDIIVISTTFGKGANGKTRMNFGPLSASGSGKKRLNVLASRAKEKMVIFCSISSSEIDQKANESSEDAAEGTALFCHFLRAAKDQKQFYRKIAKKNKAAPNPFEQDIEQEINCMGYKTESQVGFGPYALDIVVFDKSDPSRMLAVVECDGATYHSASSARERDRLRETHLNGMGWGGYIHRVWSTHWFRSRKNCIAIMKNFLDQIQSGANASRRLTLLKMKKEKEEWAKLIRPRDGIHSVDSTPDNSSMCLSLAKITCIDESDESPWCIEIFNGAVIPKNDTKAKKLFFDKESNGGKVFIKMKINGLANLSIGSKNLKLRMINKTYT